MIFNNRLARLALGLCYFYSTIAAFAGSNVPAQLTISISKVTNDKVTLKTITDIIKETEKVEEFAISKDNPLVRASFQIDEPTLVRIVYDTRSFDCYLEPGQQLQLFFEGNSFPQKIQFAGDGAAENTYLQKAMVQFQKISQRNIQRKMFASSSLSFRAFIDQILKQKWAFYRDYAAAEKAKFSPSFIHFAAANIDYWRASLLMQYREEHETALLTESSSNIPDDYYTFLDETLVNNDKAFSNPYYRNFLRLYGWFRLNHPNFKHGLAARQLVLEVNAPSVTLYENIDLAQPLITFPKHTYLILADKMSYEAEDEKTPIAYRLRVRTTDGIDGWLRPTGLSLIRPADINQNVLFIENFEIKKKKKHTEATIEIDSLKVYTDQDDAHDNFVVKLGKKDRVSILNAVTVENRSYLDWDTKMLYTAPFQKIRTNTGILGWVTTAGIDKQWLISNIIENKAEIEANCRTLYDNIDYFFYGKAKYYLAALVVSDGFSKGNGLRVKPLFNILKKENTYVALTKSLETILEDAEKNKDRILLSEPEERQRLTRQSVALNIAPPNFRLPYASSVLSSNSMSLEEESRVIANERKKRNQSNKKNINEYKPKNLDIIKYQPIKYDFKKASIIQVGRKGILKKGHFYVQNSFVNENPLNVPLATEKNGSILSKKNYVWELNIAEPTMGIIYVERDSFEVFLEPNDALELETFDKNGKTHTIAKGQGSLHFRYIQASKRYFSKIEKELLAKKGERVSAEEFKAFMDEKLELKKEFYEKFPKNSQFSAVFKTYALAEIQYWHAYQLLAYAFMLENNPLNQDKEVLFPDNYFEFIPNKEEHAEYAIYSNEYRKFIELYHILAAKSNKDGGRAFPTLELHQRAKSYRQAQHLLGDLSSGFLDNKKIATLQQFVQQNTYPALNETLLATYNGKLSHMEMNQASDFSLLNADGGFNSLSDYKGRVVYLFFWKSTDANLESASEMVKRLKADYAKRNIIFLNINLDETQEDWKASLKGRKNMGISLFHQSDCFYDAPIEMSYQIGKTPAAIVLDEQGKIAKVASSLLNDNLMIQKLGELLDK
jgi:peroxiredoxin